MTASNPFERIQECYESLTSTDKEIAYFILNNPRDCARLSIGSVAELIGVSKSALVRFSSRIGYSGFAEFKFDLSRFLVTRNSAQSEENPEPSDLIRTITDTYSRYILMLNDFINQETMSRIAEKIVNAKRVKILGKNRTFNSAMQLRQRLSKIGLDAEAVNDSAIMSDLSEILNSSDVMIIFTIGNSLNSYADLVRTTAEGGCPIICFTMTEDLSFRDLCDEYVVLPRISHNSSISFLDDQAIYFVMIEILLDLIASLIRK